MGKTILLKNASLLTEEAECISSQNVYVKDGKIAATAMQSPHFDAQEALDMAVKLAAGEEPAEFYNYIETPVATQENVDSLGLEEW